MVYVGALCPNLTHPAFFRILEYSSGGFPFDTGILITGDFGSFCHVLKVNSVNCWVSVLHQWLSCLGHENNLEPK